MVKEEAPKVTPVYIRSADHTWVPALQLKSHDGKATVSVPKFASGEKDMLQCLKASKQFPYQANNQSIDLKEYPNSLLPVQNVDSNGNLEDYKDMVDLPFMHEVRIGGRKFVGSFLNALHSSNVALLVLQCTGCHFVQLEASSRARKAIHSYWRYRDCCQPLSMVP